MRAIEYTPVRFPSGKVVHANSIKMVGVTMCNKILKAMIIVPHRPMNCTGCMTAIVKQRKAAHRKSRGKAVTETLRPNT